MSGNKAIVSSSGTIALPPSVVLPPPPVPLPSMGGIGRGMNPLTPSSGPNISSRCDPPNLSLRQAQQHSQPQTTGATYSTSTNPYISSSAQLLSSTTSVAAPVTATAAGRTSVVSAVQETFHRIVFTSTAKFFGVHAETEECARATWNERRRRLAIKRFGGVKDEYLSSQHHQHPAGANDGNASGNTTGVGMATGGASSATAVSVGYASHHFPPQVSNKNVTSLIRMY